MYDFLDSALFGGIITDSLLNEKTKMPEGIENHAKLIMLHFMSYQTLDDLQLEESYLKRFQQIWKNTGRKDSIQKQKKNLDTFRRHLTIIVFLLEMIN